MRYPWKKLHQHYAHTHTRITRNPQCRLSGYKRTDIRVEEGPWTKRYNPRVQYYIYYIIIIIRYTEQCADRARDRLYDYYIIIYILYISVKYIYYIRGGVIIGGPGGGVCVLGVAYPGAAQGRYRFMIDIVTTFFG